MALAPASLSGPSAFERPQRFPAVGPRRKRVALLAGCAQQVLAPEINEATVRLLNRLGCEVILARGSGCCGALTHHLGQPAASFAKANIDSWSAEIERGGLDAIVINASGCGTQVKDYGFMLREDAAYAGKAARISGLAKDISEFLVEIGMPKTKAGAGLRVAYHSACSLQHGQRVQAPPKALLEAAGFEVVEPAEGHLCCGSAGTYNMLQPEIATALRDRKLVNIANLRPDLIAAGNLGCITQLGSGTGLPILHTVELLDWATGGPRPAALASLEPAS